MHFKAQNTNVKQNLRKQKGTFAVELLN